jgi:hypothetical protein
METIHLQSCSVFVVPALRSSAFVCKNFSIKAVTRYGFGHILVSTSGRIVDCILKTRLSMYLAFRWYKGDCHGGTAPDVNKVVALVS